MKSKFDNLVVSILKEAGFMNALRGAYNIPSNFAKAAAGVRDVVQSGEWKKPEANTQDQTDQTKKTPTSGDKPKLGDTVKLQMRGLGATGTAGYSGKIENPKQYQGGMLYDVKLQGNPNVERVRILDKPTPQGGMTRQVFYMDKSGMQVNPNFLKQKQLNPVGYFGLNPNIDKSKNPMGREWILSDNEYPFLPKDEQEPGTPGIPPKRK